MTDKNEPAFEVWQPIETAPKDGRGIILARFSFKRKDADPLVWLDLGYWWDGDDGPAFMYDSGEHYLLSDFGATHWMPLPNPPLKESEGV